MSFRGEHLINILAYGVNLLSDEGRTDLEAGTGEHTEYQYGVAALVVLITAS